MSEEAWEWDGTCSDCYRTMDWDGDEPETEDEALCWSCDRDRTNTQLDQFKWAVVLQQFILPDVGWLLYIAIGEDMRSDFPTLVSMTREEYGLGWAWAP